MPAPYRWTTNASFIGGHGTPHAAPGPRRRGRGDRRRTSRGAAPLEGKLLDAGEEHLVRAALPLECVAAVLIQPSEHCISTRRLKNMRVPRTLVCGLVSASKWSAPVSGRPAAQAGSTSSCPTRWLPRAAAPRGRQRAPDRRRRGSRRRPRICARSRSRTRACNSVITASTGTRASPPKSSPTPARTWTLCWTRRPASFLLQLKVSLYCPCCR